MTQIINQLKAGKLKVKIYENRQLMGVDAANDLAEKIRVLLDMQEEVNIIFAAAPSQNEFLGALSRDDKIDWKRINAFHMDEYVGLDNNHPERFGNFLKRRIFGMVPFHQVFYLNENASDVYEECKRYTMLLGKYPPDIVCMGIGENAHLAFNDPHVADFNDPVMVKIVDLDEISRQQQVNDGCFPDIKTVPVSAVTLTVPVLLRATSIYCIVPGIKKAEAVYHTLYDEVSEKYPSTSLRKHPNATLYLDKESAAKLNTDAVIKTLL